MEVLKCGPDNAPPVDCGTSLLFTKGKSNKWHFSLIIKNQKLFYFFDNKVVIKNFKKS